MEYWGKKHVAIYTLHDIPRAAGCLNGLDFAKQSKSHRGNLKVENLSKS